MVWEASVGHSLPNNCVLFFTNSEPPVADVQKNLEFLKHIIEMDGGSCADPVGHLLPNNCVLFFFTNSEPPVSDVQNIIEFKKIIVEMGGGSCAAYVVYLLLDSSQKQ